jgi:predicted anti-sigma-YlaC factor YlaD
MSKFHIQLAAVIIGCLILGIAIWPSAQSGQIHESISTFAKAFGGFFQAIIYGAFAGGGDGPAE